MLWALIVEEIEAKSRSSSGRVMASSFGIVPLALKVLEGSAVEKRMSMGRMKWRLRRFMVYMYGWRRRIKVANYLYRALVLYQLK